MSDVSTEESAVAVVDALGVKDIWKKPGVEPADVIEALRAGRDTAIREGRTLGIISDESLQVRAFSDAVIITGQVTDNPYWVTTWVARTVAELAVAASKMRVPLAYRGCISLGRLATAEDFFVGPAIDEAARWHEQADAAITWVTPSATRRANLNASQIEFLRWPVPLKQGGPVQCLAVNPLWVGEIIIEKVESLDSRLDNLIQRLLAPFNRDEGIDVVRKRQNTEEFLVAAKQSIVRKYPDYLKMVFDALSDGPAESEPQPGFWSGPLEEK